MGTYTLADSITGEAIPEGSEVVAFLLADGGSENTTSYLFAETRERYKLASLPIKGKWNGSTVDAHDDSTLAVKSALYAANSSAKSFADLQDGLYTSSKKEVPSKWSGHPLFDEGPKEITFSMFVTKPSTIDFVVGGSSLNKHYKSSLAKERAKVDLLMPLLIEHAGNIRNEDKSVANRAYGNADRLAKTIFFESGHHRFDGVEDLFTAGAMSTFEGGPFSNRLTAFLETQNLYGIEAFSAVTDTKILPDTFDEAFQGIYQAKLMTLGMHHMNVSFNPATGRNRGYRDDSRIDLLRHMLKQELGLYIEQTSEDMSQEALREVDKALEPLRKDVGQLVKARNKFCEKVEKFEAKYGQ
jgi:hypothetical protein